MTDRDVAERLIMYQDNLSTDESMPRYQPELRGMVIVPFIEEAPVSSPQCIRLKLMQTLDALRLVRDPDKDIELHDVDWHGRPVLRVRDKRR